MLDPQKWDAFTMKLTEKWIAVPRIYRVCLIPGILLVIALLGWIGYFRRL
ncbi:hypothetical protein [Saccharibacillus sp. O23]|nr:hypothetical protein [Saccharibacillus sp. O23]